ncbi:hypothetical protein DPMN_003110 [Dreissena polymorpha]|uniref:Uncharacterized protein n=1 Tax=Dreissena polymorpha TaxID=45954 RepID=A0A9D4RUH3_DREPO|nr:hypothetical protein DPMN_003110 [Dreissena polymorpha]
MFLKIWKIMWLACVETEINRSSIFFLKVKGLSFSITKEGGCGGVGTGDGLVVSSNQEGKGDVTTRKKQIPSRQCLNEDDTDCDSDDCVDFQNKECNTNLVMSFCSESN